MKAIIKDVAFYVPVNELDNDYFINLYKEKDDNDFTNLLDSLGRDKRKVCGEGETVLTMAVNAIEKLLKDNNLSAKDIDMMVFSSGTPEYTQPCNAIKLHYLLGLKKEIMIYDMNASCTGMVVGLTQVESIMRNNPTVKRALVVGSEQLFTFSKVEHPISYIATGDSACCVLLENVDTEDRGLIDYNFETDSFCHDAITFPQKGTRYSVEKDLENKYNFIAWEPVPSELVFDRGADHIKALLDKNGIDKSQIKKYFVSQANYSSIKSIANILEEDLEKFKYIGDRYGYTGTTSPFIALKHSMEDGEVKEGDYIAIWSIGTGATYHASIFKL